MLLNEQTPWLVSCSWWLL